MRAVQQDTAQRRSDASQAHGSSSDVSSGLSSSHGLRFSTEGWESSEVRAACDAMVAETVASLDPVRREVATEVLRDVVVRHSDARLYTERTHVTALVEHGLRLPVPLLGGAAQQANRIARAEGGAWCGGGAEPPGSDAAALSDDSLGAVGRMRREAVLRRNASRGMGRMACGAPWLAVGQGMGAQSMAGGNGSRADVRPEDKGGHSGEDEDEDEDEDAKYRARWVEQPYRTPSARDADLRGDSTFRRPPGPVYAPDVPCLHALGLLVPRMPGKVDRSRIVSRCVQLLNYEGDLAARRVQLFWRSRAAGNALLSYSSGTEAKAQMHIVVALQLRRVLLRRRWTWMRAECEGGGVLSALALQYLLQLLTECLDCTVAQGSERTVLSDAVLDDDGDGRQHGLGDDDDEDEEEEEDEGEGGYGEGGDMEEGEMEGGQAGGDGESVGGSAAAGSTRGAGGGSRHRKCKDRHRKHARAGAGAGDASSSDALGPAHLVQ